MKIEKRSKDIRGRIMKESGNRYIKGTVQRTEISELIIESETASGPDSPCEREEEYRREEGCRSKKEVTVR